MRHAALVVLAVLASSSSASALELPSHDQLQWGQYVAETHWKRHAPKCLKVELGESYVGTAAITEGCTIRFAAAEEWTWHEACRAFVHELGHVFGLGHTTDPNNIMFGDTPGYLQAEAQEYEVGCLRRSQRKESQHENLHSYRRLR